MHLIFVLLACIGTFFTTPAPSRADETTLIYAGESETTINPLTNYHQELPTLIFSGLMKHSATGQPIPDLAERMEYDPATKSYTFTLRKDVLWHDGKPFTAADVVFTYKALVNDQQLAASITSNYRDIKEVVSPDPYTVVITLSQYNAAMPSNFTIGILPKHIFEGKDMTTAPANQHPIGTGRYTFVAWDVAGGTILLARNERYYGKKPAIARIVYKTVAVESTKALMLQSGEADLAWLNARYADTFRNNPDYTVTTFSTADYRAISMDFRTPFWKQNADSIAVLNFALDKPLIIASVLQGQGIPAFSPIQKSRFGGNPQANCSPYDLQRFHETMKKLGWQRGSDGVYSRNGQRFSFTIQVRDYEEERIDLANVAAAQLKKAGVEMNVVLVTAFDWKAGYNGFLWGTAAEFDPDNIYKDFVTGASDNAMQYSNTAVDQALQQGRSGQTDEERRRAYAAFELAYAQAPGHVLLAYLDGNYVSVAGLKGLDTRRTLGHHAVGVMWNIEDWTLER